MKSYIILVTACLCLSVLATTAQQDFKYGILPGEGGNQIVLQNTMNDSMLKIYDQVSGRLKSYQKEHTRLNTFNNGSLLLSALPAGLSFVKEDTFTTDEGDFYSDYHYFDGLGRMVQKVGKSATPAGYDMVNFNIYDNSGRPDGKVYMSYPSTGTDGSYDLNALTNQRSYYTTEYGDNGRFAFMLTDYINGTGILSSFTGPGADPQGFDISFEHLLTGNKIKKIVTEDAGYSFSFSGYYSVGSLLAVKIKPTYDYQAETTPESVFYTDAFGKLIATDVITSGGESHMTHYVYDQKGRLVLEIPSPLYEVLKAGTTYTWGHYMYSATWYKYDKNDNPTELNSPDQHKEFCFDRHGRLRFYRETGEGPYQFIKYDVFDRPIMVGKYQADWLPTVSTLDRFDSQSEIRQTLPGNIHGYSNMSYPNDITENDILHAWYYDDYDWTQRDGRPNGTGKLTGEKYSILADNITGMLDKVHYYDENTHRPVQSLIMNPEGFEVAEYRIGLTGRPEAMYVAYAGYGGGIISHGKHFDYDNRGRLIGIDYEAESDGVIIPRQTLVNYEYREDGNLRRKTQPMTGNEVIYSDDMMGRPLRAEHSTWTEEIFRKEGSGTGVAGIPDNWIPGRLDGKISGIRTTDGVDGTPYHFRYDYNNHGYLSEAESYVGNVAGVMDEKNIRYNENGNILSLVRTAPGAGGTIRTENISLEYDKARLVTDKYGDTNQLAAIDVNGQKFEYIQGIQSGRIMKDGRTGETISYNILGLPQRVTQGDTVYRYIYTSDGRLLAKSTGNLSTDYRNDLVFETNTAAGATTPSLSHLLLPEAMVTYTPNGYLHKDFDTDYRGDVRAVHMYVPVSSEVTFNAQSTVFYPLGSVARSVDLTSNPYLLNGKPLLWERGDGLSIYDFAVREYDAYIGRFRSPDPLPQYNNPYLYNGNDPINRRDNNGMWSTGIGGLAGGFNIPGMRGMSRQSLPEIMGVVSVDGQGVYHIEDVVVQANRPPSYASWQFYYGMYYNGVSQLETTIETLQNPGGGGFGGGRGYGPRWYNGGFADPYLYATGPQPNNFPRMSYEQYSELLGLIGDLTGLYGDFANVRTISKTGQMVVYLDIAGDIIQMGLNGDVTASRIYSVLTKTLGLVPLYGSTIRFYVYDVPVGGTKFINSLDKSLNNEAKKIFFNWSSFMF